MQIVEELSKPNGNEVSNFEEELKKKLNRY